MKKLSKEQAAMLIEQIHNIFIRLNYTPSVHRPSSLQELAGLMSTVKQVIEECAEKEFPKLCIDASDHSQINIDRDNRNNAEVYVNVVGEYAYLNTHEFKIFTEGCNKIVAWLDEQETNTKEEIK